MKAITPFLWFDDDLEEAIDLYTAVFPEAKVGGLMRGPDGKVTMAEFELAGQQVKALNGGPEFPHTEAFSFMVECEGQEEVDHYWRALTADGGEEGQCGWLKDRFGLSWQIVPVEFFNLVNSGTPEQVGRVMGAMLKMQKMDVAALQAAYDG